MKINIPGYDKEEFTDIVIDFNGTLAIDGKIIENVKDRFISLSKSISIHVVTGDTYGNVLNLLKDLPCKIHIIPSTNQAEEKLKYIMSLDTNKAIAVGNGRNDELMLKEAGLGISILQDEGLFTDTLTSSDLIYKDILDVFDSLLKPNRLKASLRN